MVCYRAKLILFVAICLMGALYVPIRTANAQQLECLSDMLADRTISCTQGWGVLGIDASAGATAQPGPKLRIKDKEYARGLGTHANSDIIIDLSGQFKTFEAQVGAQWQGGTTASSVGFQIFVDGKKVFDSGPMRENDAARPVKISVEGAGELRLVVNDAGDGITADSADWADARLTRDPAAKDDASLSPVDIAPFARVLSWDPKVMEGTKAMRSDEFPAKDIAPYKEILASADGTYSMPTIDGLGSIGLQWEEDRVLRRVEIEFPSEATVPEVKSVQLQYWTGESAWQGKWQPAKIEPEKIGNRLVCRLGSDEAPLGTPKVRWIFSNLKQPIAVKQLAAFTRSRWHAVDVRIEPARPDIVKKGEIEVYNGVFLNPPQGSWSRCTWDGSTPLLLKVRASVARPCKTDRTVLRFRMLGAAFGVAVEDLLTNECVYVPHANVFVTRVPAPITAADYLKKLAGQESILQQVRQKPDQNLAHVASVVHSPIQDRHNWVPTLISLACDNRKYLVHREGSIVFNEYSLPDDYPGESDGIHTTAANIGQWQLIPSFGGGRPLQISRHLQGGWLPMPVTTATDANVAYQQTTCVAPVGDAATDKPAWLRERALAAVEYVVKNNGPEAAEVRIAVRLASLQDPKKSVSYREINDGVVAVSGDRVLAFFDNRKGALAWKPMPDGVAISGKLPAGGENKCAVYLPAWKVAPGDDVSVLKNDSWSKRAEEYWKNLLAPAMQVEIPDEFLGNLIRASQVHCTLAARNQERSKYVVPWIAAVHFAYPESEASSIMRGMDMTGHPEFARRGLEFYLKEANPAGFITILVHNKVANISCGYTLVGTGEILWTLGEHYQRAHDRQWMKKVAPDVVRICQWVMRQRAKTKLLDAKGAKPPEYGLMPPGVSADWNRFAYRFFNDAQWYRGLQMAGQALADIGDPAAPAILADAKEYREDIERAYHEIQARSPVVRLKNGVWVPGNPALLNCYGNVEDFLPGEDVNRTYVYSVEIGANHLVANEVLGPTSDDANWIVDYLEDDQFLRTRWIKDPAKADAFDWGGYAKMQPYYCRIADIHAMRDDVKPFIRSYFNVIPALVNFEDLTFWEDMISDGYASGAWNKTHETGWFLGQTRTMFVAERGDDLWLAPFVTNQWLKDGQTVAVRNAPTRFGEVGYTIESHVAQGKIAAVVQLPKDCTAKKVVLRLRHPDGKPIRSISVRGTSKASFDAKKETITMTPGSEAIRIVAKY